MFCLQGRQSCHRGRGGIYSYPARQASFSVAGRCGKTRLLWTLWPLPSLPLARPPDLPALPPFIHSFFGLLILALFLPFFYSTDPCGASSGPGAVPPQPLVAWGEMCLSSLLKIINLFNKDIKEEWNKRYGAPPRIKPLLPGSPTCLSTRVRPGGEPQPLDRAVKT